MARYMLNIGSEKPPNTITLSSASSPDTVSLTDGSTYATLAVNAGRGPQGRGFTGGSYNAATGQITFTSNDGIGFTTDDVRVDLGAPGPIGDVTPSTGAFTSITVTGTVDGRDVATDGVKLDGIEAGADVTDTANVTAAGALMDSELTDEAAVKALDQGVATTDSPSFVDLTLADKIVHAGDTNTAIRFPDADTVTVETGGTERVRIDSSGNVLVGTTNADPITVNTDGVSIGADKIYRATVTGGSPVALNRKGSDGDIAVFAKDGTTVGSIATGSGRLSIGNIDTGLEFVDAIDAILPHNMTTNGNRDNSIDLGYPTQRFKDLYLSGGVYLGGIYAANYLDDVEYGTFTPSFTAGVTGPSYTQQQGRYTKIGDTVFVHFFLQGSWTTTGARADIGGLPFAKSSSPVGGWLADGWVGGNAWVAAIQKGAPVMPVSNNYFYLSPVSNNTYAAVNNSSTDYIEGSFSYHTST